MIEDLDKKKLDELFANATDPLSFYEEDDNQDQDDQHHHHTNQDSVTQ
jgi:hypothetical protein